MSHLEARFPDKSSDTWWQAHPELAPKPQAVQAGEKQDQEDEGDEGDDEDDDEDDSGSEAPAGVDEAELKLPFDKERYKYDRGFKTWSHLNEDDILVYSRKSIGEEITAQVPFNLVIVSFLVVILIFLDHFASVEQQEVRSHRRAWP